MSDQSKATATYRRLFGYLRPYWLIFMVGIFANLLYGFVDTEFVKAFEPLIDDAIYGDDKELLAFAPLFILIIIVLRGIASFTATYAMSYVGTYLVHDLRRELFTKYVTLPAQFFDQHKTGDLISTLTYNSEQLKQSTTEAVTTIVRSLAIIIFALIGMFQNSWKLSLIFLVTAPIIGLLVNVISRRFRTISTRIQNAMSDITHVTQEGVENYQTIRVYAGQEGESKRFADVNNGNRQQSMKLESTRAASVSVIQVIAGAGISVVFYFGIQMIEQGELSGGAFIATLMLMALILKPLKDLTSVNAIMQRGIAAAQSLFDIIDLADEPNHGKASVPKGLETITVAIDSFQYVADKPAAIKDFNAQFAAGKTTAIVGQSGSGKSTLIGLLLRFYTPQQGKIEIAGKNINELELTDYRSAFAYVSQDVALFNASVADNIAYGALKKHSRDEIIEVCRKAYAWDFIEQLPEGLDTIIGERGSMLSGGQKQRLAIARALLKDAPILILDEATSALDTESEKHIQQALQELIQNRTTIVIAHRLSTIEGADTIFVMQDGHLIEQGSHNELIAASGAYAQLHQIQFQNA